MSKEHHDLHGNAPDRSAVALMLIDLINDLEFEGGAELLEPALAAAERIAKLKARAHAAGIPVIYANDNFGRWRSDFREVVEHCLRDGVRGQPLVERLAPDSDDYFVLKPKHSAFFATTLDTLLEYLGTRRLILTGMATDVCVTFTAMDAFMRDLEVLVPSDCVVSVSRENGERAIAYLRRVADADPTPSTQLDLEALRADPASA
jgi:nicotinamidase-related amidase